MVVRKEHLLAFAMIVVIAVAYFAQRVQNDAARAEDRATNVRLCVASVERSAFIANGFRVLADRVSQRAKRGDQRSADIYQAVTNSIISTFPGVAQKDSRVERVEASDGTVSFRIPNESRVLQETGCRQEFK